MRVSFNEKIQYSMAHDRNPLKPFCTDKLLVKDYIEKVVGPGFTPKTYCVASNTDELIAEIRRYIIHPKDFLIKANNDSGGTGIVRDMQVPSGLLQKVSTYRDKVYAGYHDGEWFYGPIKHKVFTEEIIGENLTDYKFHCSCGEVRFVQIIRDRALGKRNEVCVDLEGNCLDFKLTTFADFVKVFDKPFNWKRMIGLATMLSREFDYVRVDMYNLNKIEHSDQDLYVGELTFAPERGRYAGPGQVEAGKLLLGL